MNNDDEACPDCGQDHSSALRDMLAVELFKQRVDLFAHDDIAPAMVKALADTSIGQADVFVRALRRHHKDEQRQGHPSFVFRVRAMQPAKVTALHNPNDEDVQ